MNHHSRHPVATPTRSPSVAPERRALRFVDHDAGAPLAPDTRRRMEASLGHSFAEVRVHDGPEASLAAEGVHARAFTIGQDIVFRAGALAPGTDAGDRLLGHELAHSVQNARAVPGITALLVSNGGEPAEKEARQSAAAVGLGAVAQVQSVPAAVIARSPEHEEKEEPGILESISKYLALGSSVETGRKATESSEVLERYSEIFNIYNGGSEIYGGLKAGGLKGGVEAGKGVLDIVSGYGGLGGSMPIKGGASMGSGGIDVARGLSSAIGSDDIKEATGGAYQAAHGMAEMITGWGDATKNPLVMGGGRALNWGLGAGEKLVNWTDAGAKERGDFGKDSSGENRTGSEAAADTGLAANEAIRSVMPGFVPDSATDVIAGVGGAATSIGTSWYNAGKGAVNNIRDNITLDPDEIDFGKTIRPWRWFD
jgi:hypothetical protein